MASGCLAEVWHYSKCRGKHKSHETQEGATGKPKLRARFIQDCARTCHVAGQISNWSGLFLLPQLGSAQAAHEL